MSKKIILVGGGGHCKSIIESINTKNIFEIVGVLDVAEKVGTFVNGIKIVGQDDMLEEYYNLGIRHVFLSIGNLKSLEKRVTLYKKCRRIGYSFPNIIDSSAKIAKNIKVGRGNFIGKGVIINADSIIKNQCIINTGAIIDHDCEISNFTHIAPGCTLSGGVFVGDGCHIGVNSTIIQNIRVGGNTVVGAGSVVLRNIEKNKIAYGNPCREVRDNE